MALKFIRAAIIIRIKIDNESNIFTNVVTASPQVFSIRIKNLSPCALLGKI